MNLSGWALDDVAFGGTDPYVFPPGTWLDADGYRVAYRSTTGVALNQDADTVRLLAPGGVEVNTFAYARPAPDRSYSRTSDGAWTDAYPPSPGGPNLPPTPTSTATATQTATPIATPSLAMPGDLVITEIMHDPAAVADSVGEWFEVTNASSSMIDLNGWMLRDAGRDEHRIQTEAPLVILPGEYIVLGRSADIALNGGAPVAYTYSGFLLANGADEVILLDGGGREIDRVGYDDGITFPDPTGASLALIDPALDNALGASWRASDAAWPGSAGDRGSPGAANPPSLTATATPTRSPTPTATRTQTTTPTPTPTVTPFADGVALNEILPDPRTADWDADGSADYRDEWVEIYNRADTSAALGGWVIADATQVYTLPVGTMIWPRAYLLLFRAQTHLSLSDYADTVTLYRPDGAMVDQFAYAHGPGGDRSYCREIDGSGAWTRACAVTPGRANRLQDQNSDDDDPQPAPTARPSGALGATRGVTTIAAARRLPEDTRVTIVGVLTLPPGYFGRNIYLEDETGGVRVYLRVGDYPTLAAGDRLRVTGWTRQYHGEAEISVPDATYLALLGPGKHITPRRVTTGALGETDEGRLVLIAGRAVRFAPNDLVLDDGSGPVRIFFPDELPWRRPYVHIGQWWTARGVVSQYLSQPTMTGGYRLIPAARVDPGLPPLFLPETGGPP